MRGISVLTTVKSFHFGNKKKYKKNKINEKLTTKIKVGDA
jgi:hypothetical protein